MFSLLNIYLNYASEARLCYFKILGTLKTCAILMHRVCNWISNLNHLFCGVFYFDFCPYVCLLCFVLVGFLFCFVCLFVCLFFVLFCFFFFCFLFVFVLFVFVCLFLCYFFFSITVSFNECSPYSAKTRILYIFFNINVLCFFILQKE